MRSIKMMVASLGITMAMVSPAVAEDYYSDDDAMEGHVYGGMEVSIGGGAADFAESDQRDFTGTAGIWDARVAWGTLLPVAVEVAYIGSAQTIDRLGLSNDAVLLSNGAEIAARFNILPGVVRPYVHGGAAWRSYKIVNSDRNTSDVLDSDNVFEVPLGVGADVHFGNFVVDGRASYRIAFDDDLVRTGDVDSVDQQRNLHTFGARLALGMEF
jgi:hypothetical protein